MSRRVRLADRAEADLASIWLYGVTTWSVPRADRYLTELGELFDLLSEHPEIARLRRDTNPPVRVHPHGSHVVIFREPPVTVEILRVVHARSDWVSALGN